MSRIFNEFKERHEEKHTSFNQHCYQAEFLTVIF